MYELLTVVGVKASERAVLYFTTRKKWDEPRVGDILSHPLIKWLTTAGVCLKAGRMVSQHMRWLGEIAEYA